MPAFIDARRAFFWTINAKEVVSAVLEFERYFRILKIGCSLVHSKATIHKLLSPKSRRKRSFFDNNGTHGGAVVNTPFSFANHRVCPVFFTYANGRFSDHVLKNSVWHAHLKPGRDALFTLDFTRYAW